MQVASQPLRPSTASELPTLDTSLLNSSPPDGTELRQANILFNVQVQEATGLSSLAKRFSKRMTARLRLHKVSSLLSGTSSPNTKASTEPEVS